jgi:hypothetical protein
MKKLLLTICTFLCLLFNAQLDTDHWFAPMASKSGQGIFRDIYIYPPMKPLPFSVQIYNSNALYTTVQVSKGNPAQVNIPNSFLITTNPSDLFSPNSMGVYLKGTKNSFQL